MMMPRKNIWFGFALAMVMACLVFVSADARPKKKKKQREPVSGPPTLSLSANPTNVRNCPDESSRVQLVATASSPEGRPLRYKWTTNGGKLTGQGANTTWDFA